ncbi:MAG: phosphatase PAP2 family protein [archaeon]
MIEEIIVNQFLQSFSTPLLDLFFKAITLIGHPIPWLFVAAWFFWLGKERLSLTIVSGVAASMIVAGALKAVIMRPRPEGVIAMEAPIWSSMPSGHATIASSMYFFFVGKVQKYKKIVLLLLLTLVLVSRIYLGMHYLSDVLAGLALGFIVAEGMLLLEVRLKKSNFHISRIKEEALLVLLFGIVILGLFYLPTALYLEQVVLGYFVGAAIYAHGKHRANPKKKIATVALGSIVLVGIVLAGYINTGLVSQLFFLLSGLFVTLIWPYIVQKIHF